MRIRQKGRVLLGVRIWTRHNKVQGVSPVGARRFCRKILDAVRQIWWIILPPKQQSTPMQTSSVIVANWKIMGAGSRRWLLMSNSALFYVFLVISMPSPEGLLCFFSVIYCHGPAFVSDNIQNSQWSSFCHGPVFMLSTVNGPVFVSDNLFRSPAWDFFKWWLLQVSFPPAGQSQTMFCLSKLPPH